MNQKSDFHFALKWIIEVLHRLNIPYQIVGDMPLNSTLRFKSIQ